MHIVSVAQPFLGLPADLALLALDISSWNELISAKVVAEIFSDHSRFCNDNWLGRVGALDRDNRRFAQRVDLL